MSNITSVMTPREIVEELDNYIIGQDDAKRAVAVAVRDRWRRSQLRESDPELSVEITPKNILMIGPTGVGKTEIARRLARLTDAPFVKVEATKFTEVGYVGRDVDTIIRDLVDRAMKKTREKEIEKVRYLAEDATEARILDALLPPPTTTGFSHIDMEEEKNKEDDSAGRQMMRKKLREGKLDDKEIEIEVAAASVGVEIVAPPGMEEMTGQLQNMFQNLNTDRTKVRKLKIKDAVKIIQEEEAAKLLNEEEVKMKALEKVEQNGIVFIDEIDKVCRRSDHSGVDVSREGVQRDLLPLIEGSTVSTKYGMVKTDHILFIASGAFHLAKPSDLIPELQGRLPIRVELKALSTEDFKRILTEPSASLTKQYAAMLGVEGVTLDFDDSAIVRLAQIAWHINENTENIGARRLHTVMERLLERISFDAPDKNGQSMMINSDYVNEQLNALVKDEDLSHFIL